MMAGFFNQSSTHGHNSNRPDNTVCSNTPSFSVQSGAGYPPSYDTGAFPVGESSTSTTVLAGNIQGLHNFHGNLNAPNMQGDLGPIYTPTDSIYDVHGNLNAPNMQGDLGLIYTPMGSIYDVHENLNPLNMLGDLRPPDTPVDWDSLYDIARNMNAPNMQGDLGPTTTPMDNMCFSGLQQAPEFRLWDDYSCGVGGYNPGMGIWGDYSCGVGGYNPGMPPSAAIDNRTFVPAEEITSSMGSSSSIVGGSSGGLGSHLNLDSLGQHTPMLGYPNDSGGGGGGGASGYPTSYIPTPIEPSISSYYIDEKDSMPYNPDARRQSLERYRSKKNLRKFNKIIRYESRKIRAETRPRIRGRFVRRDEIEQTTPQTRTTTLENEVEADDDWTKCFV